MWARYQTRIKCKEAPATMLLPMIVIAIICILFGVYNQLPLNNLIQPIIGERYLKDIIMQVSINIIIVVITILVLIMAFFKSFIWS